MCEMKECRFGEQAVFFQPASSAALSLPASDFLPHTFLSRQTMKGGQIPPERSVSRANAGGWNQTGAVAGRGSGHPGQNRNARWSGPAVKEVAHPDAFYPSHMIIGVKDATVDMTTAVKASAGPLKAKSSVPV